ncbi:MAG: WecB/TagA/CpsF family glycosyltransferase [Clostridia bacterium]|nr:WecB/TagA/CpsF family glycosyltransferase [Clostridia bacterium]
MNTVDILGVKFSCLGVDGSADYIMSMLEEDGFHYVFTPNSEMVMAAVKDKEFEDVLNSANLLTADGIGIIYASKILSRPIAQRASGYDISLKIMEKAASSGKTFYLFGAAPGVADKAKEVLETKYAGIKIVGTHDGYFDAQEEIRIIEDINEKTPDILFVCLGCPKQEKWIFENRKKLNAKVAMGLGGCLDVYAGNVKRAPDIYIKLGLEWFYRLMKEPKRFFRMLALPKFMLKVIWHKLTGK